MTSLEYMERELRKNQRNYEREAARGVPEKMLADIREKIGHYKDAVEALRDKCWEPVPEFPKEGM